MKDDVDRPTDTSEWGDRVRDIRFSQPDRYPAFEGLCRKEPPRVLHHYTDQKAAISILEKRAVWATHTYYLNDSAEFALAVGLVKSVLDARKTGGIKPEHERALNWLGDFFVGWQSESFVFSLSRRDDDLSQWRAYCPAGAGVALGFHTAGLRHSFSRPGMYLLPCEYDEAAQRRMVDEIVDVFWRGFLEADGRVQVNHPILLELIARFSVLAPLIKHHTFRDEEEWRLVVTRGAPDAGHPKVRPGRSTMIPYLEISIKDIDPMVLLEQIRLGPTSLTDLAIKAAADLCTATGVRAEPLPSGVPYRTW